MIATLEDGFQPLVHLTRRTFPSRGSFAPVVLRSPFFGLTSDILVSSDQLVLISGASVEYLFGVEEALISAASLCDGKVAVKDERRALTDAVAIDLGHPFAITADGCCLMSTYGADDDLPRRALRDYEALPLLTLLGRTALRHVA
jgi:Hint domain